MTRWCPVGCGKTVHTIGFSTSCVYKCVACGIEWRYLSEYENDINRAVEEHELN